MPEALVIIPTFNERDNIGKLIDHIFTLPHDLHVLVIDDDSPDGTAGVVQKLQQKHGEERLKLMVRTQGKAGRGSACIEGFQVANDSGYPCAIEMDADLSHDPVEITNLLTEIQNADVVIGSKQMRGGKTIGCSWYRRLLSYCANLYIHFILRVPIGDYTSGYRCYNSRALVIISDLVIDGSGFTVLPQMSFQLHKSGMKFKEIPITFVNRRFGTSNANLWEIFESLSGVLRIRSYSLYVHFLQTFKFGVTGVFNAMLDLGLLMFFVEIVHLPLRIAVILASALAITSAFLIHKFWTFNRADVLGKDVRHNYVSQYIQFLLVYGSSFLLGVGTTIFFAEIIGVWYVFSRIIAIPLCAVWNYLWLHCRVFRDSCDD